MGSRKLSVVLFLSLNLTGCSSKAAPEPFWIGHLAPLTGADKARGVQAERAVRLAVDPELRVLNRPVAVLHVDTQGNADLARAEAVRLIAVNKVAALLVGMDGTQAERLGREAQPYGVPVVVCGEVASVSGDNVFALGAGPEARGRALAIGAAEVLNVKSVAVLTDGRSALTSALAAAFVKQCRKDSKGTVAQEEYVNDQEFKDRLAKLLHDRPAAVLLAGSAADLPKVRAACRAADLAVPLLFGGEDRGTTVVGDEGKDGPGVYVATVFAADGLTDKGRDFARRYQEAYSERPDLAAALAYDGTRLLYETIRQTGTVERARLRDQLAKTDAFESVTGPLSFKDRQARRPVFLVEIKGGEKKVVKTVPAEE